MPVDSPALLSDGIVTLRVPDEADIDAIAGYAPHAIDNGIWLPTGRLDVEPRTWAAWFIQELRLGWTPFGGRYGGGLLAGLVDGPISAYLNFVPHEPKVVELCYGVAPEFRGRNIASRAARLAAEWAISVGCGEIQLHISVDHAESQRVAAKAGFEQARQVTKHVPATGASYEDIIFTRSR
jgi:RimJ/RimL family protein N-acetyltransferase